MGRRRGDLASCGVAAGEERRIDGLLQQGGADRPAAHHDLEHAVGHPRLAQELPDREPGHRRELGGLVKNAVPGQEGRHEDVGPHEVGIVPGRDVGDHPEGLVGDVLLHARARRHHLVPQQGRGGAQEVVDPSGHGADFIVGLLDGLSHLAREGEGQAILVLDQRIAEASDRRQSILERSRAPGRLGLARAPELLRDAGLAVLGNLGDHLAGGGIHDLHGGDSRLRELTSARKAARSRAGSRAPGAGSASPRMNSGCHCTP